VKLISRLNWKLNLKPEAIEEDDEERREEYKNLMAEK